METISSLTESKNTEKNTPQDKSLKWVKVLFFSILLIGSSYYFGTVIHHSSQLYNTLIFGSQNNYNFLFHGIISLSLTLYFIGIIAAIVRPFSQTVIIYIFAAISIIFGWQELSAFSFSYAIVFILTSVLYANKVEKELKDRIHFSSSPVKNEISLVVISLLLIFSASVYSGAKDAVYDQKISSASFIQNIFSNNIESQIPEDISEAQKNILTTQLINQSQSKVETFIEENIEPQKKNIPYIIAFIAFCISYGVSRITLIILKLILPLTFILLKAMGITKVEYNNRQVEEVILG